MGDRRAVSPHMMGLNTGPEEAARHQPIFCCSHPDSSFFLLSALRVLVNVHLPHTHSSPLLPDCRNVIVLSQLPSFRADTPGTRRGYWLGGGTTAVPSRAGQGLGDSSEDQPKQRDA